MTTTPITPLAGLSPTVTTFFSGDEPPTSDQGVDNGHFLNLKTGALYKKISGSWNLISVVNISLITAGIAPGVKTVVDRIDMPGSARSAKYLINLYDNAIEYFVALEIRLALQNGDVEWTVYGITGDAGSIPHNYLFEVSGAEVVMSITHQHSENLTFNASRTVALV